MKHAALEDDKREITTTVESDIEELEEKIAPGIGTGGRVNHNETLVRDVDANN